MGQIVSISDHLSAKQRDALLLMAQGSAFKEIAERTGVAIQTLYNWKSSDHRFRDELSRLQQRLYDDGIDALRGLVHEATATLGAVMSNPSARDSDRISAARTVLQFAVTAEVGERDERDEDEREFRQLASEISRLARSANAG